MVISLLLITPSRYGARPFLLRKNPSSYLFASIGGIENPKTRARVDALSSRVVDVTEVFSPVFLRLLLSRLVCFATITRHPRQRTFPF